MFAGNLENSQFCITKVVSLQISNPESEGININDMPEELLFIF